MSENIPNDAVDADGLFDIDFTSSDNPESPAPPQEPPSDPGNQYEAVEDVLGLPRGSTKEGLAAAKQEVKRITDEAKNLKTKAKIIDTKEKMSVDTELMPGFSLESLENDRRVLRDNYMDLFRRGKKVLDRIEQDLEDLVNPEPDDYANYQRQYLAMLKTLDSIRNALVTLRDEEEKYSAKTKAEAPAGGVPGEEGAGLQAGKDGGVEVAPQDTNSWIAQWTAELDAEMLDEIQKDFDERNEKRLLENQEGEAGEPAALPSPENG